MFRTSARPTLALLVAAAMVPRLVSAQYTTAANSTHHWLAIGVGGGEIIPTATATTEYKSSFQGQAYVVINLGILPELRFNLGYQRLNFKQDFLNSLGVPTATSAHNNVLAGIAGTRIDLLRLPVRPYLILGVGAFNFKTVIDTGSAGGKASTTTAGTTKFGLDGGAGIAVNIGRFEGFTEARVQNVFTDKGMISSARQIQAVPISVGLLFHVI